MAAIFTLHVGKVVVQIAIIEIPIKNLLKIRSPESIPTFQDATSRNVIKTIRKTSLSYYGTLNPK